MKSVSRILHCKAVSKMKCEIKIIAEIKIIDLKYFGHFSLLFLLFIMSNDFLLHAKCFVESGRSFTVSERLKRLVYLNPTMDELSIRQNYYYLGPSLGNESDQIET